jgi:hypothetical protein
MIVAVLVAAACVTVSVTFKLFDTDFWHHLLVGRVIWETRSVPTAQLWSWPTYGGPEANSAWLFRALLWPFWSLGGVNGLFLWRWPTTLAAFGLQWATARRMGAKGFAPLAALVLCAFIYRLRSQVRPETLVAVLMALQIWILEARRRGGADRSSWLVPIAWIWANAHVSSYLGFVVLGIYLAQDALAATRRPRGRGDAGAVRPAPDARRLALVGLAALAISFVNPFGGRALWQPFDFALHLRGELMYRTIAELKPVDWPRYLSSALPVLVGGWIALVAWRGLKGRFDMVEVLAMVAFTTLALSTQRFLGFYALVATPFLMRGVGEWASARRWPQPMASPWVRAAIAAGFCLGVSVLEWRRPDLPLGIGFQWDRYPVKACDFIAANGIRGRGFNNFEFGGYQAWRFWPDRGRLPFMTGTLEAATREDRFLYAGVFAVPDAWRALDRRHRFDYVLLLRRQEGDNRLLDVLDADTTWALVFADDAATVYVRRAGPLAAVAARLGAGALPAGGGGLAALGRAMAADTALVARVAAGLRARAEASPFNARDLALLANVELGRGRTGEAGALVRRALAVDPGVDRGHLLLAMVALAENRPRDAVPELERQRALTPAMAGVAVRLGQAWQRLGDIERARAWYRRELDIRPGSREALDSLGAIGRRAGR